MRKKLFLIPLTFILFLAMSGCSEKNIAVTAESAILMSPWTKRVIYSKSPHKRLSPASTTKLMTSLLVLKKSRLKKEAIVSGFASSMEPSKVYIKEGESYFIEDLLKAALLNSGNDASVALAESIAGSEQEFAGIMNDWARKIGAKDTNFRNSNGLPAKDQYTTTYDLALIMREAMKDSRFVEMLKMKYGEIEEIDSGRRIKLKNHNKSLWKDTPYSIFGKTGYTREAKHCFAGYIQYNRWRKVIVVILKSRKLWQDLEDLAESGLEN